MTVKVGLTGSGVLALAGVVLGLYVLQRAAGQAGRVADAVVGTVGDAAAAVLDAVAAADSAVNVAGLPEPDQVIDSPEVARWIIDARGYLEASKWVTTGALLRGAWLDAGTGYPPAYTTAAGRALGVTPADAWAAINRRP